MTGDVIGADPTTGEAFPTDVRTTAPDGMVFDLSLPESRFLFDHIVQDGQLERSTGMDPDKRFETSRAMVLEACAKAVKAEAKLAKLAGVCDSFDPASGTARTRAFLADLRSILDGDGS